MEHLTLQTPRDVNFYSFFLTQRSDVDLNFTFPGDFDQLQIPFTAAAAVPPVELLPESQDHNSHSIHVAGAMPGQYMFKISRDWPYGLHDVTFKWSVPIAPDSSA